jgi:hypothetical protein
MSRALEQYLTHSGESVLAMDVAEWLYELFPSGQARGRELLSLARMAAEELPRFSISDRPAPAPPARESLTSLSAIALPLEEPRPAASPATVSESLPIHPSLHPRLSDRILAIALTGSMALVGVGVLGSLFRHLPSAATRGPAPVAALNSLMPSVSTSPHTKAHPAPLAAPNSTLEPASEQVRIPAPRKLAAPRTKLASVAKPSAPAAEAVAAFPSLQAGSVFISTPGTNVDVFESGRSLGQTPRQIELSPGAHTLLLKSETHARAVVVDVKPGSAAVLSLVLPETPAQEHKDKLVISDR